MTTFVMKEATALHGSIRPTGNKNAALPLLAALPAHRRPGHAAQCARHRRRNHHVRHLADLGVEIETSGESVTLCARNARSSQPDVNLFSQIRGSLTLMGPLLARRGPLRRDRQCRRRHRRRIDTHIQVFEALGAQLVHNGKFELHAQGRLHGADILLDEASVTATENGIMAAALAKGTTILRNAASEPHVQDVCNLLVRMGCPIEGIGSNVLTIHGQDRLHGGEIHISPDFIEVGSYIGLGAITPGELRITGVVPEHLRMVEMVFVDRLGVNMTLEHDPCAEPYCAYTLVVGEDQELCVKSDFGGAVPKIDDAPWPAFPPDLMSIALVAATQAQGTVIVHEKMYESRLYFVDKLITMGAKIILCDPHRAVVVGPSRLVGQHVTSPDIRAGMALLLAALAADGVTTIGNVQQIDRGYQQIDHKLRKLGAHIERIEGNGWHAPPHERHAHAQYRHSRHPTRGRPPTRRHPHVPARTRRHPLYGL